MWFEASDLHCWTEEFSGSLSSDISSYSKSLIMWDEHEFMVLLLVNFNKIKGILRSYFHLHLPFGRESVLKFMCLSSNISVLNLNHRIFLSCKRVNSPRYITCVRVYLEIWQEDSNGSSCCGAYLEHTGRVCCCLLVTWCLWYHFK